MTFSETPEEDRHEAVSGTTDLGANGEADLAMADRAALPATDGFAAPADRFPAPADGFSDPAGNGKGHPRRWWILGFLCLSLSGAS